MIKKVVPRSIVFAFIVSLALAFISATGVFAASPAQGAGAIPGSNQSLSSQWKSELADLKAAQAMNNNVGKLEAKWLEKKHPRYKVRKVRRFTARADLILQQAEIIATSHPGFDAWGNVINRVQAAQSLQYLSIDMHKLHLVWRDRLLKRIT
ncbi:MAG: hypothetical protein ACM3XO_12955 [Bacteroidota bacterium]